MTISPPAMNSVLKARATADEVTDWWGSAMLAIFTTLLAVALFPDLRHWFVVPVCACGVLIGKDAVAWLRGRLDTFSPQGVIGIFGLHFFFLSPLLHVLFDYWPLYVTGARDWRDALGNLGIVNFLGLLAYRAALRGPTLKRERQDVDAPARLRGATIFAVGVGVASWIAVVLSFGGPVSYFRSLSDETADLTGYGSILLFAESWPAVLACSLLVGKRKAFQARPSAVTILILVFLVTQFIIGGLRGSRASTVWPLLLVLTTIHLAIFPIKKRLIAVVAIATIGFSFFYGFYKALGSEVADLASTGTSIEELAAETNRSAEMLLLSDFGRAGEQALVLDRILSDSPVQLRYGETYIGDLLKFIPDSLHWRDFDDKTAAGTDVLHGPGAYVAGSRSSRIFGLAGESFLNFGPLGILPAFLIFGMLVRAATTYYDRAVGSKVASRKILAATLPMLVILGLMSDLDNLILACLKYAVPAIAVFWAAEWRSSRERHS